MDTLRRVLGHLVDIAAILALGTVYVVALSVGTLWKACVDLVRWAWASVSGPEQHASSDDGSLPTHSHEATGKTEK